MQESPDISKLVNGGTVPFDANTFLHGLVRISTDDVRSNMLRRDGYLALALRWGGLALDRRIERLGADPATFWNIDLPPEEGRFSTLEERLVQATNPKTCFECLENWGSTLLSPSPFTSADHWR